MQQPEGLTDSDNEHLACLLLKAIYELTQAPRAWHKKLTKYLKSEGYMKCNSDACIYVRYENGIIAIIGI